MTREQAVARARDWLRSNYGIPRELTPPDRDAWNEKMGFLYHFLTDVFPK